MAKNFSAVEIKALRQETNLSQPAFCERYGFNLATYRNWEQGLRVPNSNAQYLLSIIEHLPTYDVEPKQGRYVIRSHPHQFKYNGKEKWRAIPSHPNYQASNKGRIRSMTRQGLSASGRVYFVRGKILTQRNEIGKNGRICAVRVTLRPTRNCLVHRLVLEAFVGPAPLGMEGCHNDGNAANNSLHNLRWDTHYANAEDAIKHSGKVPMLNYRLFGDKVGGGGTGGIKHKSFVSDYLCGLAGLI